MPRYYFHITNGQESLDNPKGMDLPGNATARQEAVVLASRPIAHARDQPVPYRIEMNIVDMSLEITLVPNGMLPETTLP